MPRFHLFDFLKYGIGLRNICQPEILINTLFIKTAAQRIFHQSLHFRSKNKHRRIGIIQQRFHAEAVAGQYQPLLQRIKNSNGKKTVEFCKTICSEFNKGFQYNFSVSGSVEADSCFFKLCTDRPEVENFSVENK
ncbi:hypothetical protein SDC9_89641 [bioreactor metagenome]|uniref:Uncharacterized protein n=1 Tax=bioreactor metagenome TaxID=1076179 RepID=A0A644ZPR9_9ZZZZ